MKDLNKNQQSPNKKKLQTFHFSITAYHNYGPLQGRYWFGQQSQPPCRVRKDSTYKCTLQCHTHFGNSAMYFGAQWRLQHHTHFPITEGNNFVFTNDQAKQRGVKKEWFEKIVGSKWGRVVQVEGFTQAVSNMSPLTVNTWIPTNFFDIWRNL